MMRRYYNIHTLWLAMLLLTLSTYALGKLKYSGTVVTLIILVTVAIKATFIIRDFMELRGVSLLWRSIMYGWLSVVCTAITISYIIST
ncbi:MAG: cytochrome C oxidase subunit IV family protein [Gammaproteobacteria bacterium]|nr:cytochrome C oxidase subunit IV family protein [Gammaproteobacteria bacterium]